MEAINDKLVLITLATGAVTLLHEFTTIYGVMAYVSPTLMVLCAVKK